MAIPYKIIHRTTPGARGGERALYPQVVVNKKVTPDEFYALMAEHTRWSKADIIYFLLNMKKVLMEELTEGNIVQTEFMGSFYPSIRYKARKGENRVDKENIVAGMNYRPSLAMKKALKNADLEKVKG